MQDRDYWPEDTVFGEEVYDCPSKEVADTWDCKWLTGHRFGWKGYIACKRFSGGDISKATTMVARWYVWTDMWLNDRLHRSLTIFWTILPLILRHQQMSRMLELQLSWP